MKRLKIVAATLLVGVLLFALASCGGASGTLSSFVGAVKKADFTKAATYVVGNPSLSNPTTSNEMGTYIFEKAANSFSYKVTEENSSSDENSCTVKLSYSGYSGTQIALKYAARILSGSEATKGTVDNIVKEMTKKEGTTTVVLVKNDSGDWKVEAASATALVAIIYG